MNRIKNVLIIGLGAIGSIYAAKLSQNKALDFRVLLDSSRLDKYKLNGIVFNSKRYDFNYLLDTETGFKADLILIATKSTNFMHAAKMISNFVNDDTVIMSLLNGLSSEKILEGMYGDEKVLYSYYLGHAGMKAGNSIEWDGIGQIYFGEKSGEISEKVRLVSSLFSESGISYAYSEDIISAMWQKLVINIGANQTLAVFKLPYGYFNNREVRQYSIELMQEAIEVAKALQVSGTDKFLQTALDVLDCMTEGTKPSMLQDVECGRETEVDIFAGEICRLGKVFNIDTPKNAQVLQLLSK